MRENQKINQNRKRSNLEIATGTNNALKCSKGKAESPEHRYLKFVICNYCWQNSLDFASEVVFKNNSRGDIVIKDWFVCIEILKTEKIKGFIKNKTKRYPMPTIPFHSCHCAVEIIKILDDLKNTLGSNADYYSKWCKI